jgi:gamma-butyrobetaine dioxygenase
MMDNARLLHGRSAFQAAQGARHLQGCYMDADDILSAVRVAARGK